MDYFTHKEQCDDLQKCGYTLVQRNGFPIGYDLLLDTEGKVILKVRWVNGGFSSPKNPELETTVTYGSLLQAHCSSGKTITEAIMKLLDAIQPNDRMIELYGDYKTNV